jgi:hypothetical protein
LAFVTFGQIIFDIIIVTAQMIEPTLYSEIAKAAQAAIAGLLVIVGNVADTATSAVHKAQH